MAGIWIKEDQLICNHLGDSKIIVVFNDSSWWCSKDHSLVQELLDADIITEEQAKLHPKKNVITKCFISTNTSEVISQSSFELGKVNRIYLFSDGVLDLYNPSSIVRSVKSHDQISEMEKHCKNAKDNCTFVLIEVAY